MSKKAIFLILFLLILGGLAYVGYSFTKITADIGDTTVTSHINRNISGIDFTYEGYILISTNVNITNNAVLGLENLHVDLKVYFTPNSGNTEYFIGQGNNTLGDIPAGVQKQYDIEVNATEQLPMLATNDGTLRIEIYISVNAQFIPYTVHLTKEATAPWQKPNFI